jgi:hypothetical protein
MEKNNTKIRLIFNFLLWILFGILITLLPWYVNFDNYSNSNDSQSNKITDYNVLNTVFSGFNNIKLWNSPINQDKYNKFEILYNQLEEGYYDEDKIDYDDMMENSFKWFIEAINDPYTVYFTTDESDEFQERGRAICQSIQSLRPVADYFHDYGLYFFGLETEKIIKMLDSFDW